MGNRFVLLCLLTVTSVTHAAEHFDGRSWWEVVKVLADDKYEGRNTGSPGERGAQEYLVGRLKSLGIQPAGTNGYYQPVDLRSRELEEANSTLVLLRDGDEEPLTLGQQAFFSTRVELAPTIAAPLVFVGYGLKVPEQGHDDFAGLDLKGKIAVVFAGSPAPMPSALAAHYQSLAERWKALKAAGAVGVLGIPNPAAMDIPWTRMSLNRTQPSMALVGADFDETAGDLFAATFNPEYAELLFAGTGHSFAEIADLGKDRKPLPRFALPLSLRASTRLAGKDVHSNNVVAVIPGSDPVLKREYVVLTAHIDHLGIGEPINGDRINNGAMDNASGSAMLLDVARSLKRGHDKLKRSVLFVWVTGEEKGLLGSRYYATRPTVPAGKMVADLNTDMFLPIVPLKVLTVYGLAESDLGDRAAAVAAHLGYRVQADPEPLRNSFIRSDQYNFIKQGVPSLAMKVGFEPGSAEEKVFKQWLTDRYHAPSDDADQPVNLEAAAGFEEVMRGLTVQIANDPRRPAWKGDSFFRRFAKTAP
ncbi:MAG TPA: M28 family metallopeptidase [Steroidobacteraceae bacterium]|nr:M28 family metallopeptidase [Steroidobacteraceae bacterium]